jgi:uridylate kinase
MRHLEQGRVVIFVAGTGNPFFSTDTTAALRASEIGAEVIFKATKVDGIYTADPKKDPTAKRYDSLTYAEAMAKNLRVMDMTALAMCNEHKIPVLVFDFRVNGNIAKAARGETLGTLLHH